MRAAFLAWLAEDAILFRDGLIIAGFDRPNIRYMIAPRENTTAQIADLVAYILSLGYE